MEKKPNIWANTMFCKEWATLWGCHKNYGWRKELILLFPNPLTFGDFFLKFLCLTGILTFSSFPTYGHVPSLVGAYLSHWVMSLTHPSPYQIPSGLISSFYHFYWHPSLLYFGSYSNLPHDQQWSSPSYFAWAPPFSSWVATYPITTLTILVTRTPHLCLAIGVSMIPSIGASWELLAPHLAFFFKILLSTCNHFSSRFSNTIFHLYLSNIHNHNIYRCMG